MEILKLIVLDLILIIGTVGLGVIVTLLILYIISFIANKIDDFNKRKRIIPKDTIFYLDGKRVRLKKDIVLNFKKVKYTECSIKESTATGVSCGSGHKFDKDFSQSDFESKLLQHFKQFKGAYDYLLEYVEDDNVKMSNEEIFEFENKFTESDEYEDLY